MVVRLEKPRRCAGDDGAALVEAAFVTPVLLYFLLGVLEMGLLFKSYLAVGAATQDGARTAAVLGKQADADYQIIQAVKKSTSTMPRSSIRNLVVFKATSGASSVVPVSCANSTSRYANPGANCNTYTPGDDWDKVATDAQYYNCTSPGWSAGYCPTDRKVALTSTSGNGPPDYLGIYISVDYQYATKLFGTTKQLSDTAITQLEPQSLQ